MGGLGGTVGGSVMLWQLEGHVCEVVRGCEGCWGAVWGVAGSEGLWIWGAEGDAWLGTVSRVSQGAGPWGRRGGQW